MSVCGVVNQTQTEELNADDGSDQGDATERRET